MKVVIKRVSTKEYEGYQICCGECGTYLGEISDGLFFKKDNCKHIVLEAEEV